MTTHKRLRLITLLALFPSAIRAEPGVRGVIAETPDDYLAFVSIPNLQGLDADYRRFLTALKLQERVPHAAASILDPIKAQLGAGKPLTGFKDDGNLSLLVLAANNIPELMGKVLVSLPATEPEALLTSMGGQKQDGGTWSLAAFGQVLQGAAQANRVVLSPSPDIIRKLPEQKPTKQFTPALLDAMQGLDLVIGVNAERAIEVFRAQLEGLFSMALMMQVGAGEASAEEAQAAKKQLDVLINGVSVFALGLSLEQEGAGLRIIGAAKPGSDLAKQSVLRPTRAAHLRGLPGEGYVLAVGGNMEPESIEPSLAQMDVYLGMLKAKVPDREAQLKQLRDAVAEGLRLVSHVAMSVEAPPRDTSGLIRGTVVFETKDATKAVQTVRRMGALIGEIVKPMWAKAEPPVPEGLWAAQEGAETMEGAKLDHFRIDLAKVPDAPEDAAEVARLILGADGLLIRWGAVDAKTIVVTIGGGSDYARRVIVTARSGESPIESDAGVKRVAAQLPAERSTVAYLQPSRALKLATRIARAMGQTEDLPFDLGDVETPLAFTMTGGDGWSRSDIYVPMDLAAAIAAAAARAVPPPSVQ